MRALCLTLAFAAACESGASEGRLYSFRAGIVEAITPTHGIGAALPAPPVTAVEVDASKNAIRIVVPALDSARTCGNAYSRIGLAKLKIPKGVTVTCEVAGAPPAWRVRECGGELWSIDLLDSGEAQRRGAPPC